MALVLWAVEPETRLSAEMAALAKGYEVRAGAVGFVSVFVVDGEGVACFGAVGMAAVLTAEVGLLLDEDG